MKHILLLTMIAVSVTLMLGACGIKPSRVDPPSGEENKPFPSRYPKNAQQ